MPVSLKSVERAYERYARYYDFVFGRIFHPGRKQAISQLPIQLGDKVLEVGVGTGLSLSLYPKEVDIYGIDLSKDMLKRARERVQSEGLTNVKSLELMDAQDMSYPDADFDHILAMYVASVAPDPSKLVSEIYRVCKPGGTIVFLNHFESQSLFLKIIEGGLSPLASLLGFHPNLSLESFKKETGFEPEKILRTNVFGYWKLLVAQKKELKKES